MTTIEMAERIYCSLVVEATLSEEDVDAADLTTAAWLAAQVWRDSEVHRSNTPVVESHVDE